MATEPLSAVGAAAQVGRNAPLDAAEPQKLAATSYTRALAALRALWRDLQTRARRVGYAMAGYAYET